MSTTVCKVDGCEKPPLDKSGVYALLCADHKEQARATRKTSKTPGRRTAQGDALKAVIALRAPAQAFDRAKAKVAALPSREKIKASFDEAARLAQLNPSTERLARLTDLTKELQAGQPRRQKLETELALAEQQLRQAVTGLATTLKMLLPAAPVALDEQRRAA